MNGSVVGVSDFSYLWLMQMDKTVIRKGKIAEQGNDFEFWQSRPIYERLLALEQIRDEYNRWKYGAEQRLQRVYTIVKRAN